VLQAEHALLMLQGTHADLKARHLAADVALARALGGGYRTPDPLPPSPLALNPSPTRP
jgi:outer membrane protein TolC